MKTTILLAERTNRAGDRMLGAYHLDTSDADGQADTARGYLIGNCRPASLVAHVSRAARNARGQVTIIAATYDLVDSIADELDAIGIGAWRACRGREGGVGPTDARAQVAIPEALHVVGRRVWAGTYRPNLVFVVDPESYLDRRVSWKGWEGFRGQNVGRFLASCSAAGARPRLALWTAKPPASFSCDLLRAIYGLDAWVFLDGSTLRTAAAPLVDRCEEAAEPVGTYVSTCEQLLAAS